MVSNVIMANITKPLCYISNKSLLDGRFPDKMKIAKVIPIYKSGDKNFTSNYRPISFLPQFSKIFSERFKNFLT